MPGKNGKGQLRRAVGLISGGLDSTVVAAFLNSRYKQYYFLFIDYGQKTVKREMQSFLDLTKYFKPADYQIIDMKWLRKISSSGLFEKSIKLGRKNQELEYVPFRNASLLCAGVAWAESLGANEVLIGSTGGDRICPDNSKSFIRALQKVVDIGTMTKRRIEIRAPLIQLDKRSVIKLGLKLHAPFQLSWSCHNNGSRIACGECSNCRARYKAFSDLGLTDPIRYEKKRKQ